MSKLLCTSLAKYLEDFFGEAAPLSAPPPQAEAMAMARARLVELIVFEEIEPFPHRAINDNQFILSGRCQSCFLIYLCKYNERVCFGQTAWLLNVRSRISKHALAATFRSLLRLRATTTKASTSAGLSWV